MLDNPLTKASYNMGKQTLGKGVINRRCLCNAKFLSHGSVAPDEFSPTWTPNGRALKILAKI